MSHIDIQDVVAHIKPEYVLPVERQSERQNQSSTNAATLPEEGQTAVRDHASEETTLEPPTKKQKLSGMNKKRPKLVKAPKNEKLCRSVWCVKLGEDAKSLCPNPNCEFSHDAAAFLSAKPPDLEGECHNFHTFGFCSYGIMCRYGDEHIESGCNKINEELWAKRKDSPTVVNSLTKELQVSLRKRTYNFSKAKKYLDEAQLQLRKGRAEAKGSENRDANSTEKQSVNGNLLNDSFNESEDDKKGSLERKAGLNSSDGNVDRNVLSDDSSKSEINQLNHQENSDSIRNFSNNVENEPRQKDTEQKMNEAKADSDPTYGEGGKPIGPASEEDVIKLLSREKKKITWHDKLYLAPLTTLGNLPFRRLCKEYGADITCSEMAMASCLLQGSQSEWALVKRHETETCFGIQVCGNNPEVMIKCSQLLEETVDFDFLDINMGCPLDFVYKQGGGSALMRRVGCLEQMVRGMNMALSRPLTLKMRTAIYQNTKVAHNIITKAKLWDVSLVTVHGRSREQRYLKLADWDYIDQCAQAADPMPLFGNGDVLSFEDYSSFRERSKVAGVMIGRGALVKPWVFTEIKEQRHWDISSAERFNMLKLFVKYGLEHWGSDNEGIEKTRRFLLEWLSFLHRYIPVGVLESTQRLNQRPPAYRGRDHLETLMSSRASSDWIKISEMLLGPTPPDFKFLPKHRANSY